MLERMSIDLANKVALVTDASRGIGFGLAKAMARAGAKVAVAARSLSELQLGANHPALDVSETDWDEMMAVNLKPPVA